MSEVPEKGLTPAYSSQKSLASFFNARRDDGHVTDVVDRSLMRNFAGSTATELLATLKFLKMINENGVPTQIYKDYVIADDDKRKILMQQILRDSYSFIFNDSSFDVERATADQVAQRFRAQNVSGSTLSRAVAFFLSAAKDAGIKVSPHIKAPPMVKNGGQKSKKEATPTQAAKTNRANLDEEKLPPGMEVLEIPIPINRKVKLILPSDFKDSDWTIFTTILTAYIDGWKQEKQVTLEQKVIPSKE
jgi:hypothetical protein